MNCKRPTEGDEFAKTGFDFAHSQSRPCINGTLVKTPIPNSTADSKIDFCFPPTVWFFKSIA